LSIGNSHNHLLVLSDVALERLDTQVIHVVKIHDLLSFMGDNTTADGRNAHQSPLLLLYLRYVGLYNLHASTKGMGRCS
jgi:hypothetical protein